MISIEYLINNAINKDSCLICERKVADHIYICNHCHSLLEPINLRLGREFKFINEAYSCFYYNEFMRRIVYNFKFKNKRYFGKLFGELLTDKVFQLKLNKKIDVIVPIPLSKNTYSKRGFNQAELMGRYLSEKTGIPISTNNLIKIRESQEQARLDSVDRLHNLDNAFSVASSEQFKNKNILLLDDLITTGTTVDKCAEVLHEFADGVYALSVTTIRQ